jgi:hypothetical protein
MKKILVAVLAVCVAITSMSAIGCENKPSTKASGSPK